MLRSIVLMVLLSLAFASWPASWADAQDTPNAEARRSVLGATEAFARAYGSGAAARPVQGAVADPAALAGNSLADLIGMFDEDATYAGTLQPFWLRGRGEIADLWSRYFAR